MLKNIVIGGVIGYFFAFLVALFGALWLLADWGPLPVFGAGAVVLYLILRHKIQWLRFAFLGYGVYVIYFLVVNWDKYAEALGG